MSHERFYSRVNGPTIHQFNHVRWLDEVSPRHLAGGGDPRHVTDYLLAAGWSNHSVPGYPHVLLESPDKQLHLTLEPTSPEARTPWWRIHPAERQSREWWSAQFGGHTPVEIIAGFTNAVTNRTHAPLGDLWQLATGQGWSLVHQGPEAAALAPDETAILVRAPNAVVSDTPGWRWAAEVSVPITEERRRWLWGASIDETAPSAAIAGFVTALLDTAPLLRDEGQQPDTFFHLIAVRSTVTPEQLQQMHLQRLEDARRTLPPTSPPAGRPSSPGAAHRRKPR
ncbi:DUF317 domain-containing protein [Streptomyces sp. NPDC048641]|uniref:DUF317 domain-containing protein n=1 Tax=Streptomyces sp. NPDC048641 TaxID=3154825 RepID=UPI00343C2690